ncbi:uncharacterized protein LOC111355282 [Spodoptera litura]|uniref:Uncharacterized protein LOC111355282 n=1 Tax=Spodoptera litura TaxID=69820 RepID=A0A9J7IRP1_SPOLT|nr:uncharacterized protein LOC111355282 [Spodoptera litura]
MVLKIFIIFSLLVSSVISDSCVTFDFEDGFNDLFGHYRGSCTPFRLWHVSDYHSLGLASPDKRSTKFITPETSSMSCASSFNFTMNAGGTIEFNIYMEQTDSLDQVHLMAYHIGPDGFDFVIGMEVVRHQTGWDTVKVPLGGPRTFTGYVSLYGYSARSSKVLIDSFRYIPPGVDASSCQIYGSSKMVLKTFIVVSLFVSSVISDSCVTFDFEDGFNDLFGYYGSCNSFPLWHVSDYYSLGLASPDKRSTRFITPETSWISCASSFKFTMNAGGTIEFNIYMEQTDSLDQVYLMAYHIGPDGIDFVIGMEVVSYQDGWETVKMPLGGPRTFTGYVSIFGYSARNSTVLIDSFRYIPPGVDASSCQIYG